MWYSSDITTYGGDATMEKAKVYLDRKSVV